MPANKVYKFKDIDEAELFLNGAVFGGDLRAGVQNLVGTKLKFTLPAAVEHTFVVGAGADPYTLSLADLKSQLEGAVAGLRVRSFDGRLALMEITPSLGVTLIAATSNDARAALGFDPAVSTVSKVYTPAIVTPVAPCWTAIAADDKNMHIVYVWEA
jgi:hypothetical protein